VSLVTFAQDGDLGVVTLNSPPLNLVGLDLARDGATALEEAAAAPIRALLLRAEGEQFCAGADVRMFAGRTAETGAELVAGFQPIVQGLERLPVPTLAAVHGLCLAAGLELALACDMIWAADDAQLGQVEAVIGATTFGGGAQRLVARAGDARAAEMCFTGRAYPAATLEAWNVINRVVPAADLQAKAHRFAAGLAAGPTVAHRASKRLIRTALDEGIAGADAVLPDASAPVFASQDLQDGVASLLERGPGHATFEGR
jgi:enoyl-CoA hydratase/carnithine racemase